MRSSRMNLLLFVVASLFAGARDVEACTAFAASTPRGTIVAKGFDWSTGDGWIVANERGRKRRMLVPGGSPDDTWISRFASISFTTIGPGFPVSGANEAGLAIEALVDLSGSATAHPANGRLTGLELVQYGLDRFASVGELAAFVERASFSQLAVSLHFFACDRTGACAVIEQRRGVAKVTRAPTLAVRALANHAFAEDLRSAQPSRLEAWLGIGGPKPSSSAARFRIVARRLESGPPHDAEAALRLLEEVVIPGRTRWQIVWELSTGTARFRRRDAAGGGALQLQEPRRECAGAPRVRRIGKTGIEAAFVPWSDRHAEGAARALLAQLSPRYPASRVLASEVALATRSSVCVASQ